MITKQDRSDLVADFKKVFATKDDLNKNKERIIEALDDMLSTKADKDDIEVYQRQLDNHETRILALEVK